MWAYLTLAMQNQHGWISAGLQILPFFPSRIWGVQSQEPSAKRQEDWKEIDLLVPDCRFHSSPQNMENILFDGRCQTRERQRILCWCTLQPTLTEFIESLWPTSPHLQCYSNLPAHCDEYSPRNCLPLCFSFPLCSNLFVSTNDTTKTCFSNSPDAKFLYETLFLSLIWKQSSSLLIYDSSLSVLLLQLLAVKLWKLVKALCLIHHGWHLMCNYWVNEWLQKWMNNSALWMEHSSCVTHRSHTVIQGRAQKSYPLDACDDWFDCAKGCPGSWKNIISECFCGDFLQRILTFELVVSVRKITYQPANSLRAWIGKKKKKER